MIVVLFFGESWYISSYIKKRSIFIRSLMSFMVFLAIGCINNTSPEVYQSSDMSEYAIDLLWRKKGCIVAMNPSPGDSLTSFFWDKYMTRSIIEPFRKELETRMIGRHLL